MKQILVLIALLSLCSSLNAQVPAGSNGSPAKISFTKEEMEADFAVLINAVEEVHGGQYRFVSKEDLERVLSVHKKRIDGPKSRLEFISILSETLTEYHDGHMQLDYDDQTNAEITKARLFPFRLAIEGKRLMIVFNDTPDNRTIEPGMELVSVNGHPASSMREKILRKMSGDGFIESGKIRRAERSFPLNYWLFIDQSSTFEITARAPGGGLVSSVVKGVVNNERTLNRNSNPVNAAVLRNVTLPGAQKENISMTLLKNDVAYLNIRTFDGEEFKLKLDSVFENIYNRKIKAMILDLRSNGGGVDEYGAHLVSCFADKPFYYFEKIYLKSVNPSFAKWKPSTYERLQNGVISDGKGGYLVSTKLHSGVGEQKPSKYPFLGTLVVLTNGGTFSTAADVCAMLRSSNRSTFIGEETGGAYEGNISGLNAKVQLPNSGMSVKIHMYEYWNAVVPMKKGRGIVPDYPVENKMEELIDGIDAQKSKAIDVIQTMPLKK